MNKNNRKILAFGIMFAFAFMFVVPMVMAQEEVRGVDQVITEPEWMVTLIGFLGLGETWAMVIASVAVLIMIFAAAYDILGFTAFETDWVKYSIAAGIAVVASVARGVTVLTALLMSIAGGSVAIATTIAIIAAVGFFLLASIAKGKMKSFKSKQQSVEAEGAFAKAAVTSAAHVKEANAVIKANE